MKRNFLENLFKNFETTEENIKKVIDAIMDANGGDIETAKKDLDSVTAERDNLKDKLSTAEAALENFKDIDADALNGQIEKLTAELAAKDTEYKTKLADMEFDGDLDKAIVAAKGKNAKAIRALLDIDSLKASNDRSVAIKAALKEVKGENDYLFGSNEPIDNPTGKTGGSGKGGDSDTAKLWAAMGVPMDDK